MLSFSWTHFSSRPIFTPISCRLPCAVLYLIILGTFAPGPARFVQYARRNIFHSTVCVQSNRERTKHQQKDASTGRVVTAASSSGSKPTAANVRSIVAIYIHTYGRMKCSSIIYEHHNIRARLCIHDSNAIHAPSERRSQRFCKMCIIILLLAWNALRRREVFEIVCITRVCNTHLI